MKTLRIDNIWNLLLSTCRVCRLNPISPKLFNRFSKTFLQLEDVEGGHLDGKFEVRKYFTFKKVFNFPNRQRLNFLTFNLYNVPGKIPYLKRYSTDFGKHSFRSTMLRACIREESLKSAGILLLQWRGENFAHRQHLKFPLSTCRVCQLKSYIPKAIQPILENVASARRFWGWRFGWKVSDAQVFYFHNGKVKTLRIDNIWNLGTFNM